jgi:hypothetical protein
MVPQQPDSMTSESHGSSQAGEPPRAFTVCPHCGSHDTIKDVKLSLTAETGSIGLSYRANLLLRGTEPLLADLCRQCGTVVRLHVEQTNRNWKQG